MLGFGCSMIASLATRHPRKEVVRTLDEAMDAGINFFDTADVYGQGDSERLLGTLFRSKRKDMIICTKAGLTTGHFSPLVRMIKPFANAFVRRWGAGGLVTRARHGSEGQCFTPSYLRRCIEGSLRRLGVEQIDLFLLHNPPTDLPQKNAVFDELSGLRLQGKVRHLGISCRSVSDADEWMKQPLVSCIQIPIHHATLTQALPILERARSYGIGVIVREVFAGGILKDTTIHEALTPLVRRPEIAVVLAGMTCRRHLHDNVQAVDIALR